MQTQYQQKSIIHVQNIFLINSIDIYLRKYTEKYVIGYQPKRYTFHYLKYKIDKSLTEGIKFNTYIKFKIDTNVDINVKAIFKDNINQGIHSWNTNLKSIDMRIIPTRFTNISPLYGIIYNFNTRKTGAGGLDKLEFSIPECPVITNSTTISSICYKLISKQISAGGSHGLETYLIVAPSKGQYEIGNHINMSNINQSGHRNMHVYPVTVSL